MSWEEGDAKRFFNWHPVMMICAFAFMTLASLSFRVRYYSQNVSRGTLKLLHGIKWTVAAICAIIGLVAVFKSHNDPYSGYIANLYSLHSWIGIAVITLYLYQFLSGAFAFGMQVSFISSIQRAQVLAFHQFIGPFIYILTGATILLGIQEKEGFIGCSYTVTSPDYNPIQHYLGIPLVCRISHGLGLVVFIMMLTTSYALFTVSCPERSTRMD